MRWRSTYFIFIVCWCCCLSLVMIKRCFNQWICLGIYVKSQTTSSYYYPRTILMPSKFWYYQCNSIQCHVTCTIHIVSYVYNAIHVQYHQYNATHAILCIYTPYITYHAMYISKPRKSVDVLQNFYNNSYTSSKM